MFQLTHKKEPAHTTAAVPKPQVLPHFSAQSRNSSQVLKRNRFLSSGPEDCEPPVEPEDFGRGGVEVGPEDSGVGGVGVEVESEYDLELRIGGNMGRPGMEHSSLLTVQTVR
jgi:hypothetical protein